MCAHFSSRFDSVLILECLILMGIEPQTLPQGQGALALTVTEFNLQFLDTYRFMAQPLDTLPQRFQLGDMAKGYLPHTSNHPWTNWNRLRGKPAPLTSYINRRDDVPTVEAKTTWYHDVKSRDLPFDFNRDCVDYCFNDVFILLKSTMLFIQQCFQFGEQMEERFGVSPSWNALCHRHFHPLNHGMPTLGAYA